MRQGHLYRAVQECHAEKRYPIEEACKLLHISRAVYHKWASGKQSVRTALNENIAKKVEQIHMESPDKGYRRMADDLRHDYNMRVNDKRILRICRARKIKSTNQVQQPRLHQTGEESAICGRKCFESCVPRREAKREVAYRCDRV